MGTKFTCKNLKSSKPFTFECTLKERLAQSARPAPAGSKERQWMASRGQKNTLTWPNGVAANILTKITCANFMLPWAQFTPLALSCSQRRHKVRARKIFAMIRIIKSFITKKELHVCVRFLCSQTQAQLQKPGAKSSHFFPNLLPRRDWRSSVLANLCSLHLSHSRPNWEPTKLTAFSNQVLRFSLKIYTFRYFFLIFNLKQHSFVKHIVSPEYSIWICLVMQKPF